MTELQSVLRGSAETWRSTAPTHRCRCCHRRADLSQRGCGPGGSATCCVSGGRKSSSPTRASLTLASVADRRDVGAFASRLLKSRRLMITALLVLHALAAMAGLVVPRILGSLVDAASAGGTLAATLNGPALAVTGVVVLQAILTFFALRMSVLFGQDPLAEARGVRRQDRPRAAAGQGGEREHG